MYEVPQSVGALNLSDLPGEQYDRVLERLHQILRPRAYIEIGVFKGETLRNSACPTIAVDPKFLIQDFSAFLHSEIHFYRMGSDEFYSKYSPKAILGRPLDFAFLDGMHRSEYLLRDFFNTEPHCHKNSIIALHDCLPPEVAITSRTGSSDDVIGKHRAGWWAGDVWRTALLLKRRRPDLRMFVLDSAPTGLVLITNLDPSSTALANNYQSCIDDMLGWDLETIGLSAYFEEMNVLPTAEFATEDAISTRFSF